MDNQSLVSAFLEMLTYHNIRDKDVKKIEQNCGTVWIDLKNGETYSMSLMLTEPINNIGI